MRAYDPAAPALPAIDAFAAKSARFTYALAPAAWTLPSHASLLTGVYPTRHGAIHKKTTIAGEVPHLAALLAARGYETAAFTDGGFLDASYGFGRGFRHYDDRTSAGATPLPALPRGGKPGPEGNSDRFARAEAFLAGRRARPENSEPLFLFAHTYAVHDYYKAHSWARPATGARHALVAERNLECLQGQRRCSDEDWSALAGYYRAEVRRLDGAVGRLLATARRALADRPTYVVLLSDHGEGLDPALGPTHHGGALRRELLAVPLLVAGPGVEARAVETPVSLVDVAPTLLALAGGRGADFDGRSLVPLLRDGARDRLAATRSRRPRACAPRSTTSGGATAAAAPPATSPPARSPSACCATAGGTRGRSARARRAAGRRPRRGAADVGAAPRRVAAAAHARRGDRAARRERRARRLAARARLRRRRRSAVIASRRSR